MFSGEFAAICHCCGFTEAVCCLCNCIQLRRASGLFNKVTARSGKGGRRGDVVHVSPAARLLNLSSFNSEHLCLFAYVCLCRQTDDTKVRPSAIHLPTRGSVFLPLLRFLSHRSFFLICQNSPPSVRLSATPPHPSFCSLPLRD